MNPRPDLATGRPSNLHVAARTIRGADRARPSRLTRPLHRPTTTHNGETMSSPHVSLLVFAYRRSPMPAFPSRTLPRPAFAPGGRLGGVLRVNERGAARLSDH